MSALPWFRVYHRMIDDERLRLLAFEDRWHFVAVLCLKADGLLDDDRSELWERRLAVKLGVQLRELDEIHRRLMAVGLIDAHWQPLKWDELQCRSDSSAERTRKYRERQKTPQEQGGDNVKRHGDVTVTPQIRVEEDKKEEPKGSCTSDDALKPEHVSEKWNDVAGRLWGARLVRDMTPTRRQAVKARIAQYALSDFVIVFGKIETSNFLRGDTGWRGCTFDWVMKRQNFQKILEGNYDD